MQPQSVRCEHLQPTGPRPHARHELAAVYETKTQRWKLESMASRRDHRSNINASRGPVVIQPTCNNRDRTCSGCSAATAVATTAPSEGRPRVSPGRCPAHPERWRSRRGRAGRVRAGRSVPASCPRRAGSARRPCTGCSATRSMAPSSTRRRRPVPWIRTTGGPLPLTMRSNNVCGWVAGILCSFSDWSGGWAPSGTELGHGCAQEGGSGAFGRW